QQREMRLVQRLPARRRPGLVAVLRKQLAAVERERGVVVGELAGPAREGGRDLEGVDVDLDRTGGVQREYLVAQRQHGRRVGSGAFERPPGDVQRLMEVV